MYSIHGLVFRKGIWPCLNRMAGDWITYSPSFNTPAIRFLNVLRLIICFTHYVQVALGFPCLHVRHGIERLNIQPERITIGKVVSVPRQVSNSPLELIMLSWFNAKLDISCKKINFSVILSSSMFWPCVTIPPTSSVSCSLPLFNDLAKGSALVELSIPLIIAQKKLLFVRIPSFVFFLIHNK